LRQVRKRRKTDVFPLINRERSLLAFNERVLAQCELPWTPPLEKLRYLTIVSSNLDELFEVRIAELNQKLDALEAAGSDEAPQLRKDLLLVSQHASALIEKQYRVLDEKILPELAKHNIVLVRDSNLTIAQRRWIAATFKREVAPVLSPIGLDSAHPFPTVANKGLHYIVELASGRKSVSRSVAIVKVPRTLPRVLEFPRQGKTRSFVLLSTLIQSQLPSMFPGRVVTDFSQFRVTRDSDLWVDDEEPDLRRALAGQLRRRPFGQPVRLEIHADCSESMVELLRSHFKLEQHEVYRINGPVNLARLAEIADLVDDPALRFPAAHPSRSGPGVTGGAFFDSLQRGDLLVHHPYQSFDAVVAFLRAAVDDPAVIAIKQTIYRTGSTSIMMDLLLEAVRRGKEVTIVLELKARFDEETNINWAEKLEQAGAHVVYGLVGLKTHAKLLLVLRKEGRRGEKIHPYVHVGTGNYNPSTSRFYTDFGLLTANTAISNDVAAIFHHLTSLTHPPKLKQLWWSPHTMRQKVLAAIAAEAANAAAGLPARIMAKVNTLSDEEVIEALYRASEAGVKIDLVVRGACCLAPQQPGFSMNIHVRSIVGRFLEHSRVFCFANGGDPNVYISSADWMSRNLDRRVEVATPILDKTLRDRVIEEAFGVALKDNRDAWSLLKNGAYKLLRPVRGQKTQSMQEGLAEYWSAKQDSERGE
jgi:polyphosphate kinase